MQRLLNYSGFCFFGLFVFSRDGGHFFSLFFLWVVIIAHTNILKGHAVMQISLPFSFPLRLKGFFE